MREPSSSNESAYRATAVDEPSVTRPMLSGVLEFVTAIGPTQVAAGGSGVADGLGAVVGVGAVVGLGADDSGAVGTAVGGPAVGGTVVGGVVDDAAGERLGAALGAGAPQPTTSVTNNMAALADDALHQIAMTIPRRLLGGAEAQASRPRETWAAALPAHP
jgi:hypothetical protein